MPTSDTPVCWAEGRDLSEPVLLWGFVDFINGNGDGDPCQSKSLYRTSLGGRIMNLYSFLPHPCQPQETQELYRTSLGGRPASDGSCG
jgi:hypothetical protein